MLTGTVRNLIAATAFTLGLAVGAPAFAADKAPETAAEHEATAKDYKEKAKGHRAEAEMHRKMAEMYQTQIKGPSNKKPNAWLINMVKHCKALATKVDALAAEEEKAAATLEKMLEATKDKS